MKAFASDFDNTLYHWGEGIRQEDQKAIRQFQLQGHCFGLCTGRPYSGVKETLNQIAYDFMILCNGAIILDKDGKILFDKSMDPDSFIKAANDYKEAVINVAAKDKNYVLKKGNISFSQIVIDDMKELKDESIYMLSFYFENEEEAAKAVKKINHTYPALAAYQNESYVDVIAQGCSKGSGAVFVKEKLHVDMMYGMGDSYNDIPLLQAVDAAYTFPHSSELVKVEADELADSVADALKKSMQ